MRFTSAAQPTYGLGISSPCVIAALSRKEWRLLGPVCWINIFSGYLTKPIKINEFMDTLDVALKIAQTQAARANKEEKA